MKPSYKNMNQQCDSDETFAAYPLGFYFPVNERAGKSSATNMGTI